MPLIKGTLLDTPRVVMDGKTLRLPYRKAEAVLYFLLAEKETTRDELIRLLWVDYAEDIARKNLRNALYQIRKAFAVEVLLTPGQTAVFFNPSVSFETDLDAFMADDDLGYQHYTAGFLHGFMVKDAVEFEEWMLKNKQRCQDRYMRMLRQEINNAEVKKDHQQVIHMAHKLMAENPYDEISSRALLRSHSSLGESHRAINHYETLSALLENELGVQPELETRILFESIMKERTEDSNIVEPNNSTENEVGFYGRKLELEWLNEAYFQGLRRLGPWLILLSGEAGVGKTRLVKQFLGQQDMGEHYQVETNCYQQEQMFILKPWQPIFSSIVDFLDRHNVSLPGGWVCQMMKQFPAFQVLYEKEGLDQDHEAWQSSLHQPLTESAVGVIKRAASTKKLIMIIEDMQWMDLTSQQLLLRLLNEPSLNITVIATTRDGYDDSIGDIKSIASRKGCIRHLALKVFDRQDTIQWIETALGNEGLDGYKADIIYQETGGNPFFVSECINALKYHGDASKLSVKAQDILESRLKELPEEVKKLLEITSLFYHRVPLKLLLGVSSGGEDRVIELLQMLFDLGVLKEIREGGKISIQFVHHKFREFVYLQQSETKRRHLHYRVGLQLENSLTGKRSDMLRYTDLSHHFKVAGVYPQALKYVMMTANAHLDYYHELFPSTTQPHHLARQALNTDRQEAIKLFDEVEDIFSLMSPEELELSETLKWKISYLHLKGRLLIREGDYEKGVPAIKQMIQLSREEDKWKYAVYGYQQLTYYGIQTQQPLVMNDSIEAAMSIAREQSMQEQIPVLLRLKGLHLLMSHDFEGAENVLNEAIDMVQDNNDPRRQYRIHEAACHYYLGEIRRNRGEFQEAAACYQKALDTCEADRLEHYAIAVFYTGLGQAYVELNDYPQAEIYLERALSHYKKNDVYWRRSIANAYLGLVYAIKNKHQKARRLIKEAKTCAVMLRNPYEIAVVQRVSEAIEAKMKNGNERRSRQ